VNGSVQTVPAPKALYAESLLGIFQNMLEGFALQEMVLDEQGTALDYRFLAVNPAFERLTGLSAGGLIGRTARELLPGIEDAWIQRYAAVARGEGSVRFEDYNGDLDKFFEVSAFSPGPGLCACTFLDITERMRAEQSKHLNEARLESLLAISQHRAASVQDLLDFALAEAMRLTESVFGYIYLYSESRREFVLNTWSRGVMDACKVADKKTIYALEKTGIWGEAVRQRRAIILNDFSAPHPLKKGLPEGHAPLRSYMTIPVFSGEEIVAVVGVANNPAGYDEADVRQLKLLMEPVWRIVERTRAEEQAREAQRRIESILEATGTGLDIVDSHYHLLYVNTGSQKRYGPSVGRLCHEYFQGRATPCPGCSMQRALKARARVVSEAFMEVDRRHVQITSIPFRTPEGEWLVSEIQVDITERKGNEEALRAARELMSNLLERAPVSIFVTSREGRMRLVNRQWEKDTGMSREQALDAPLDSLFPQDVAARYHRDNMNVFAADAPLVQEDCVGPADAPRNFHVVKFPLHDAQGGVEAVGGLSLDVTDMRRAEAERGKLEQQVQRAQKLESLGVLAGGIAHDFNNLLMAILGNADMALQDVSADHPARLSIQEVEKAARKAAELTRQMLAYSGRGSFVVRHLDLARVVDEMAHLLKASIPKKVILDKRTAGGLPAIEADAAQVQQVIMNLLINAAEAIGQDTTGRITVETGLGSFTTDTLGRSRVPNRLPEGPYVFLKVSDTGCGMDAETQEKIFEPFFSSKGTGRGLGLAAVLGIVRGHGGAIIVESGAGKGTVFTLLFPPRGEPMAPAGDGAESAGDAGWKGSGTVLVADDEETVLSLAAVMLRRLGFAVLTARTGAEAVACFREHASEISFVLLDLTMPVMGGIEACDAIRTLEPGTRIILSSGYSEEDMARQSRDRSVAGFIQKPYHMALLGALLQRLTAGR
jgi:two-component system, cell cycle sensor histidine kinase and response regulator CckA